MNKRDWSVARTMWDLGDTKTEIADRHRLSVKAFRTRVQKWRRNPATANWFPPRATKPKDDE
jgi:hypothetical protein